MSDDIPLSGSSYYVILLASIVYIGVIAGIMWHITGYANVDQGVRVVGTIILTLVLVQLIGGVAK